MLLCVPSGHQVNTLPLASDVARVQRLGKTDVIGTLDDGPVVREDREFVVGDLRLYHICVVIKTVGDRRKLLRATRQIQGPVRF